jgi:hypothetical protein
MPWAKLDDGLIDHPKFNELLEEPDGWAAFGFWSAMLIWANKHTRKPGKAPGLLKRADVSRMDRANSGKFAGLLVKVGFWELRDDGWQIHDFEQYLPKPETSATRAEAGRKGGLERARKQAQSLEAEAQSLDAQAGASFASSKTQANAGYGKVVEELKVVDTSVRRASAKRGTRLPPDFQVTPEMVAWARAKVPSVDGRGETEKFRLYWAAKAGAGATKVDWEATWKKWMLTAAERAPTAKPGTLDEGFWER